MKRNLQEALIKFHLQLNKKGVIVVFLSCILASLTGISIILCKTAYDRACIESADDMLHLAARSCMTEYHKQLKNDYDIFGFYGSNAQALESKMKMYIEVSSGYKNDAVKFKIVPELKKMNFNISMHPLTNILLFKKNIIDSFDLKRFSIIKNFNKEGININENFNVSRTLKNSNIIDSLPTCEMNIGSTFLDDLFIGTDISVSYPLEAQSINGYILTGFNYHTNIIHDRFYNHEVEYILTGEYDSDECYKKVRKRLKIMRMGLNLLHLETDPQKQAKLQEAAMSFAAVPEAVPAVKAALTTMWAFRESENDMLLLEEGLIVPLNKNISSWATDLSDIISGILDNKTVKPPVSSGLNYTGYINILLHALKEETKLVRLMDIIQINIKTGSDKNFLLKDYYGGMEFYAEINDKTLHFIENY